MYGFVVVRLLATFPRSDHHLNEAKLFYFYIIINILLPICFYIRLHDHPQLPRRLDRRKYACTYGSTTCTHSPSEGPAVELHDAVQAN